MKAIKFAVSLKQMKSKTGVDGWLEGGQQKKTA